ncbi:MAG: transposase [Candidatus Methanomethylicaceae archaeon]
MSDYICGIDIHKNFSNITIEDSIGNIIDYRKIKNNEIINYLLNKNISLIALESSNYIMPIYRKIKDLGYKILVSHPKKTRLIAENRLKNDKRDSRILAELARLNALPQSYIPNDDIIKLREIVRRRAFLVKLRTRLKNRIYSSLLYEGIEIPKEFNLFSKKGMEWLISLNKENINQYLRIINILNQRNRKYIKRSL